MMGLKPMQWKIVALVITVAIYGSIDYSIRQTDAWDAESAGGAEDFTTLADGLFTEHVLALEVLGILLTAAMIGAMVIARPLDGRPDTSNYPNKRKRADLDELQAISTVEHNIDGGTFQRVPIPTPRIDLQEEEE